MTSTGEQGLLRRAWRGVRAQGAVAVMVGSGVGGVAAYGFHLLATRTLGDEAFAPIGVLWTIHYLALTIGLISVEAYVARAVTLHGGDPARLRRSLAAMLAWVGLVTVVVAAIAFAARGALFPAEGPGLPAVVPVTVAGYGLFVMVRGWLAGRYQFPRYAMLTALESVTRLAALGLVVAVAATTLSVAWTLAVAPWAALLWWLVVRSRRASGAPPEDAEEVLAELVTSSDTRYLVSTTVANASSQTLLAAGPVVLVPLGAGAAEISVFFVVVTTARIPIVFALNGLLSRMLPPLVRSARAGRLHRLRRLSLLIAGAAAGFGALGALAGAWLGPTVVALLYGAAFRPPSWLVALAVAGVVGATAALGLNQVLIAMGTEVRLVVPWLVALATGALTVLLVDAEPSLRVIVAFVAGEVVAVAGLTLAVLTARREPAPAPSGTGARP
jgi:O-antigen/teichoic acid export membrane protein